MLYEEQLVVTSQNPGYALTKNSGALLMQLIAKDASPENLQIVTFHPGVIYNEVFGTIGFSETDLPYDDRKLASPRSGGFCLLTCTTCSRASWKLCGLGGKQGGEILAWALRVGFVGCRRTGDWGVAEAD